MTREKGNGDSLGRLSLLASAISSRALKVVSGESGAPAWTDGSLVFVDGDMRVREQVDAIAVQASLLAAGSLDADVVRKLMRRPKLARRYLAVEGHRALAAIEGVLPPSVRLLIDSEVAGRADSPAASLVAARGREAIADPPRCFGTIRVRRLLASMNRTEISVGVHSQVSHAPRSQVLAELTDDDEADSGGVDFSSPVGGGGTLGQLLGKLLGVVRQLHGGGPPGVDAPTHRTQTGSGGGASIALSHDKAESLNGAASGGQGTKYPEWDFQRRSYRADWCTVREVEAKPGEKSVPFESTTCGLRRPLARLGTGLDRCHRRVQGDEIDIDAVVEARIEALAGSVPDESIYIESLRRRRDLSVLLLLDTSGSAAESGVTGQTVHEQQREAAAALAVTLHEIGDRVALYAYQSRGRSAVQMLPVKQFDEGLDSLVQRRLYGLTPGAYSRLGAAIRHGAAVLEKRGGTSRRLLVVISDGLAYDHGYEPEYGAADARRALAEARNRGTACLCLSIGAGTDAETLRRIFGSAAHATIPSAEPLRYVIGPLFRSALRSAEVRRLVSK